MTYKEFIDKLYKLQDTKYRDFHKKISCSDNVIGVRMPELKRLAKVISKENYNDFFRHSKHKYIEENMVQGLTLGYLKLNFNELTQLIYDFIPYIDNWAVCDTTAANLKIFKRNRDIGLNEIKKYINDGNYWINRFGYVLLLDYYIEEEYVDEIFNLCENYKDEYYVKMAIAWLISFCYIKFKDKTLSFLKSNKLDDWTYNKAIQKIIESNRVTIEERNLLRGMKR